MPDCTTVEAPFGPVTVQVTVLICSPPGSVSCMPTEPVFSADEPPPADSGSAPFGPDEQPTCCDAARAPAPTAPAKSTLCRIDVRTFALIWNAPRALVPYESELSPVQRPIR